MARQKRCEHARPYDSDPIVQWDLFSASNHVCVGVAKLSERPELKDAERAVIRAAYSILSDVSGDILRRTKAPAVPA